MVPKTLLKTRWSQTCFTLNSWSIGVPQRWAQHHPAMSCHHSSASHATAKQRQLTPEAKTHRALHLLYFSMDVSKSIELVFLIWCSPSTVVCLLDTVCIWLDCLLYNISMIIYMYLSVYLLFTHTVIVQIQTTYPAIHKYKPASSHDHYATWAHYQVNHRCHWGPTMAPLVGASNHGSYALLQLLGAGTPSSWTPRCCEFQLQRTAAATDIHMPRQVGGGPNFAIPKIPKNIEYGSQFKILTCLSCLVVSIFFNCDFPFV